MVKHVILWQLKEELNQQEREKITADMKEQLEALVGQVPGLKRLEIIGKPLASSNADVMLDSELESQEALQGYQTHPAHVAVANTYVRPYTAVRLCMDYEI
jgi:hypothetical protein